LVAAFLYWDLRGWTKDEVSQRAERAKVEYCIARNIKPDQFTLTSIEQNGRNWKVRYEDKTGKKWVMIGFTAHGDVEVFGNSDGPIAEIEKKIGKKVTQPTFNGRVGEVG